MECLLYVRLHQLPNPHRTTSPGAGTIVIPILQRKKLRHQASWSDPESVLLPKSSTFLCRKNRKYKGEKRKKNIV